VSGRARGVGSRRGAAGRGTSEKGTAKRGQIYFSTLKLPGESGLEYRK